MIAIQSNAIDQFLYGNILIFWGRPLTSQQQQVFDLTLHGFDKREVSKMLGMSYSHVWDSIGKIKDHGWQL